MAADGKTGRPVVQRGVSTVSRPGLQRGQSAISDRSRVGAVQRGVSTISSDKESRIHELLQEQSIQEQLLQEQKLPPPTLFRRILNASGHAVLIFMLGVYSAAGGIAFVHLEGPNEVRIHQEMRVLAKESRELFFSALWDHILENVTSSCGDVDVNDEFMNVTKELFERELTTYDKVLYKTADAGVDIHGHPDYQWNYPRSMFFSATVITTIGYGNIAPITTWGRIFCIIYALFGIPLTLIAIADMGKLFADLIKYIYKKAKKKRIVKAPTPDLAADLAADEATVAAASAGPSKAKTSLKVLGAMALLIIYISLGGGMFLLWEKWSFLESFYFCFITMTTIGLGDIVPEHQMFMLLCTVYILIGLALTSTCIELARSEYEKSWQRMLEASKRLQLQKLMKKLGEQIDLHGDNLDLLQDLKNALGGKKHEEKPPPIIWYETTV